MNKFRIFYSWQSDLPGGKNRSFIRDCIDEAIELAKESEAFEAERDEATKDTTGSPDIVQSIFSKIDDSDMFIGDLTPYFVHEDKKKAPNPNVLVELGYAVHAIGWDRIVVMLNEEYGKPEDLPFDIEHHRVLRYNLVGRNKKEVIFEVAKAINENIYKLRCGPALPKKGIPLHVVGSFSEQESKVVHSLCPIDLKSRMDLTKIKKLKDEATQLADRISILTDRMISNKQFQEESIKLLDEESLSALTTYKMQKSLASISEAIQSLTNPPDSMAETVVAPGTDVVGLWLKHYLNYNVQDSFFQLGNLKRVQDFDPFRKSYTYYGSEDEKEKYRLYRQLYKVLFQLMLREEYVKTFEGMVFIPIALQNVSNVKDDNIRLILSLVKGKALYPTKDLVINGLQQYRGEINHFKLIEELLHLPNNPLVEIEDTFVSPLPTRYEFNSFHNIEIIEDEETYEAELKEYILEPWSKTHYNTTISYLRPGECRYLCGGLLIEPEENEITIDYNIHSANLPNELTGRLSLQVGAKEDNVQVEKKNL